MLGLVIGRMCTSQGQGVLGFYLPDPQCLAQCQKDKRCSVITFCGFVECMSSCKKEFLPVAFC
jgi:hypothetical protein